MTRPPHQFARLWLERIGAEGLDDTTVLSAFERTRLQSMSHAKRRSEFIAGRVLARRLIAALDDGDAPRALIDISAAGKPFLVDRPDLHLSISHSGEWVACAVASVPVGLDIECVDSKRATSALIEEVCSADEQLLISAMPPARKESFFTELWTLKEAWLKREGAVLDVDRMRSIRWTHAAPPEANCVSWLTPDALAVSVAGAAVRHLLGDTPAALGRAQPTLRQIA